MFDRMELQVTSSYSPAQFGDKSMLTYEFDLK